MRMPRAVRATLHEGFIGLCCYALLVAPFGCQFEQMLLGGLDEDSLTPLDNTSAGLFINSDTNSPLLMAGRNEAGDAFYVFGTRTSEGGLAEVTSISVETAGGETSFVTFESGRPVHAQGPDGSYVHITYTEVSSSRLAGTVELYDAGTDTQSTYEVSINLEQTANQIAELVRDVTGRKLDVPDLTTAKQFQQSSALGAAWRFLAYVVPLVALVSLSVVILGQMLATIYAMVAQTVRSVLLAVFSPLFYITGILNDVMIRVEFVPFWDVFDSLPDAPI